MRAGLPLQKSVLIPIAKNVLLPFASSVKMSAGDAATPKKIYVLSTTALIILDEEINDIMKIVKSLKESNLLIKGVSKTINNDNKEQKKISFNAIRNISCQYVRKCITGREVIRAGKGAIKAGEGTITAGESF